MADTGNNEVEEFDMNDNSLHHYSGRTATLSSSPARWPWTLPGISMWPTPGMKGSWNFLREGPSVLGQWSTVQYADIFGIAVDGSGNVFAADYGDGTI